MLEGIASYRPGHQILPAVVVRVEEISEIGQRVLGELVATLGVAGGIRAVSRQSSGHLRVLALRATVYCLAQQKDWQDLSLADRIGMGIRSPSGNLDRLLLGRCVRFHPRSQ